MFQPEKLSIGARMVAAKAILWDADVARRIYCSGMMMHAAVGANNVQNAGVIHCIPLSANGGGVTPRRAVPARTMARIVNQIASTPPMT